jgi:hypothetical protein
VPHSAAPSSRQEARSADDRAHTATKDVDTITVAPTPAGTRLTWHAELSSPIPFMEGVAIRMTAKGRSYGRQIEDTLAEVKRDVEASRAGHPAEPTP